MMRYFLFQFTLISSAFVLGNLLVTIFQLPLPGSMVGMFILLFSLLNGFIRLEWVEKAADFHLKHITLLFIPSLVGALIYIHQIKIEKWKLFLILSVSSLCILLVTATAAELYESHKRRQKE